ncbi:hypothetical protein SAMN06265373_11119 [Shimia sagamensis]|uniref:Uncharacterized protein n=2 Tax=Shimia sagamensis TaxID=1566352 RepID=A0ABY1PL36_9RHOB|nr:hypothetical protein SAMN06265373_11119 [Shimia sagamensis]
MDVAPVEVLAVARVSDATQVAEARLDVPGALVDVQLDVLDVEGDRDGADKAGSSNRSTS